jgi:transcriptional regulator with XRE-family HTH domain
MEYSKRNIKKVKAIRAGTVAGGIVDLTAIGRRIRELRGDTLQEEFAEFLGISQGQLSKIERGKLPPSVGILLRLSARLGRSADWILKGVTKS